MSVRLNLFFVYLYLKGIGTYGTYITIKAYIIKVRFQVKGIVHLVFNVIFSKVCEDYLRTSGTYRFYIVST